MNASEIRFLFREYETAKTREIALAGNCDVGDVRQVTGQEESLKRDTHEYKLRGAALDADLIRIMRRRIAKRKPERSAA